MFLNDVFPHVSHTVTADSTWIAWSLIKVQLSVPVQNQHVSLFYSFLSSSLKTTIQQCFRIEKQPDSLCAKSMCFFTPFLFSLFLPHEPHAVWPEPMQQQARASYSCCFPPSPQPAAAAASAAGLLLSARAQRGSDSGSHGTRPGFELHIGKSAARTNCSFFFFATQPFFLMNYSVFLEPAKGSLETYPSLLRTPGK